MVYSNHENLLYQNLKIDFFQMKISQTIVCSLIIMVAGYVHMNSMYIPQEIVCIIMYNASSCTYHKYYICKLDTATSYVEVTEQDM